jgi:protein involved in sex pheromone biosynthesis
MKKTLFISSLLSVFVLSACAGRHKDCLDADAFGHCNHWKGQEVSCTERVLGICTNKGKK